MNLDIGIEKFYFKLPVGYLSGLPHQLVQPRFRDDTVSLGVGVQATNVSGRFAVYRDAKPHRPAGDRRRHDHVKITSMKTICDAAVCLVENHRGHSDGDRVLQTVGEILRAHTRNTDGLGRWGGEEFVLVCPGANLAKAADLAEKLRHRIMETNFIPEAPLPITASFGVATSGAELSFEDAFRQADQALYLAKSRGRNCVVAAGEDEMHKVTGARKGALALLSGRFKLHK